MPTYPALPEQPVLGLNKCSLLGFAELQLGAGEFPVFVRYTSPDLTRMALAEAAVLSKDLNAHITLFAIQVVPFPLPLERPDVSPKFLERRLAAVVRNAGVPSDILIGFARDLDLGCEQILPPNSLVVMAAKRHWWPTTETKLARALAQAGHIVALLGV
jgi:hypothetical protein